jgi:hypothetical protein
MHIRHAKTLRIRHSWDVPGKKRRVLRAVGLGWCQAFLSPRKPFSERGGQLKERSTSSLKNHFASEYQIRQLVTRDL